MSVRPSFAIARRLVGAAAAAGVVAFAVASASAAHARPLDVEIHPSAASVPENLLRIELRFPQPQRLPFDMRRVQLIDERGAVIEHALLDLALPSADGRRITVLLDPGRVKRDVGPNVEAGRALRVGQVVSLRVAPELAGPEKSAKSARSARSARSAEPAVKRWRVTAAAQARLEPDTWRLSPPRAGSRTPLSVRLDAPISASAQALIAVADPAGRRVAGSASLSDGDAVWRFVPARAWSAGAHQLVIHPELEDAAGNRSCAAFEERQQSTIRCEEQRVGFTVPSGALHGSESQRQAGAGQR